MRRIALLTAWLAAAVALASQGVSRPPRVLPFPEAEWTADLRTLFTGAGLTGLVTSDFKTFARHPALAKSVLPFATYISSGSSLPPRHRELLILRTARLCRAKYVWAQRASLARQMGFSAGDLHRVAEGPDAPAWGVFEATLLRAADELHVNSFVTDHTWNALATHYDRPQLLDALFTVAGYTLLAGVINTFGVTPDEGAAERPPSNVGFRPGAARLTPQQIRLRQPRIPLLSASELSSDAQRVLDPLGSGRLGGTAAIYGHNLKLYPPRQLLSDYLRSKSLLATSAPVAHETLILRTSLHNRSEIEWAAHQRFGREKGMSDEQIRGILAGPDAPVWDHVEAALLRAADEMHRDFRIGDATWDTLATRFDLQQLMDIALTISGYRFITMGQNALGLKTDDAPSIPPVWVEVGDRVVGTQGGERP